MKKIIGLLVICVIFGVIFMGCQNAATSTVLEGRWKGPTSKGEMILTINGNSVTLAERDTDGWFAQKGTFTLETATLNATFTEGNEKAAITEAVALENMTKTPEVPILSKAYTLNTKVRPNILVLGENKLEKQ